MFGSSSLTPSEIGDLLAKSYVVLKFDIDDPNFINLKEEYGVQGAPYMVILKENEVVYSGTPSSNNIEDIQNSLSNKIPPTNNASVMQNEKFDQVIINPGKTEFKGISKNDPYYFGDNVPTYEERFYTDGMNGGIIGRSKGVSMNGYMSEEDYAKEQLKNPYDRLSIVNSISYYGDSKVSPQPEIIKKVEIAAPEVKQKDVILDVIVEPPPVVSIPKITKEIELTAIPIKTDIIKNLTIDEVIVNEIESVSQSTGNSTADHMHRKATCIIEGVRNRLKFYFLYFT